MNGGKETYLTIEEAAAYLKLARQTIRKWVLNKTIPYRKVQKSVRFRLSEIEKWIDEGGGACLKHPGGDREGDLFAGLEDEKPGADENDEETGYPPAADSLGVCSANSIQTGTDENDEETGGKRYDGQGQGD